MALAGFRSGGEVLLRDRLTRDARTSFEARTAGPGSSKGASLRGGIQARSTTVRHPDNRAACSAVVRSPRHGGAPSGALSGAFLPSGRHEPGPLGGQGHEQRRSPTAPSFQGGRALLRGRWRGGAFRSPREARLIRPACRGLGSDGRPAEALRCHARKHRKPLGGSKPKGASGKGQAATPGPRNGFSGGARP